MTSSSYRHGAAFAARREPLTGGAVDRGRRRRLHMLEHVPHWLGHALRNVRAGADKLCIAQPELGGGFGTIDLSSPAFADGAMLPPRFTADGEGVSPPLLWGPVPEGTRSLAL